MKPLSYLIVFFLISIIISCGSETEEEILNMEGRRLITQKEYRTSYGSSELIKYEYKDSLLVKSIFFKDGKYNSEKVYEYDDHGISIKGNNNGKTSEEFLLRFEFDVDGLLTRTITQWCCDYTHSFVRTFLYRDGQLKSGKTDLYGMAAVDTHFEVDDSGNITSILYEIGGDLVEQQFSYDDKKNPFYQLPNMELEFMDFFNVNNVVQMRNIDDGKPQTVINFEYEYDDQGYPVKMISGGDTTFYVY